MEDQSNMVDKEQAFIQNKGFRRVADNVQDGVHTLLRPAVMKSHFFIVMLLTVTRFTGNNQSFPV